MTAVERNSGDFFIDAALLAEAFGLPQDGIKARMRDGAITSRCETGVDEDAGRWRLTFHHANRACRFIVDEAGTVLTRATFPIKTRPQAPAAQVGAIGTANADTGTARETTALLTNDAAEDQRDDRQIEHAVDQEHSDRLRLDRLRRG